MGRFCCTCHPKGSSYWSSPRGAQRKTTSWSKSGCDGSRLSGHLSDLQPSTLHHLALSQFGNLVRGKSKLGKYLVGLFTELRRPRRHPARRSRQRDRLADQADRAVLGVRHILRDAEMLDLFSRQKAFHASPISVGGSIFGEFHPICSEATRTAPAGRYRGVVRTAAQR